MTAINGTLAFSLVFEHVPEGHKPEASVGKTASRLDVTFGRFSRETSQVATTNSVAEAIYMGLQLAKVDARSSQTAVFGIACRLSHSVAQHGEIEAALKNLPQNVYLVIIDLDETPLPATREWIAEISDRTTTRSICTIVHAATYGLSVDEMFSTVASDVGLWLESLPAPSKVSV